MHQTVVLSRPLPTFVPDTLPFKRPSVLFQGHTGCHAFRLSQSRSPRPPPRQQRIVESCGHSTHLSEPLWILKTPDHHSSDLQNTRNRCIPNCERSVRLRNLPTSSLGRVAKFDMNLFIPFRGVLRIHGVGHDDGFIQELLKVQVHYHIFELDRGASHTRLRTLIAADW